jgi:ABC-type multidrug transport system fused ATPase/permease subunit
MLLLIGLSNIITIFIGGMEVMKGTITPGNIAEFLVYLNQLTFPVMALGWVTSLYNVRRLLRNALMSFWILSRRSYRLMRLSERYKWFDRI